MKSPSTVGRGKSIVLPGPPAQALYQNALVTLRLGDALDCYKSWPAPTTVVSDGAYGVLGFEGDTSDHLDIPAWYEPHVKAWSQAATPATTVASGSSKTGV